MKTSTLIGFAFLMFRALGQGVNPSEGQYFNVKNLDCAVYSYSSNVYFEWSGDCIDGYIHGTGILQIYNLNDTLLGEYAGFMENGKREGAGVVKGLDGAMKGYFYEGEFYEHLESGEGKAIYPNGDSYIGLFETGARNGKGTYTYVNGDEYTGDYKADKRHGYGILKLKDGNAYKGNFWDDEPSGEMFILFANGDTYEGGFYEFEPQGYGTYIKVNGDRYDGNFDLGVPHGEGVSTTAKGFTFDGTFDEGEPYNGRVTDKKGKIMGVYLEGEYFTE